MPTRDRRRSRRDGEKTQNGIETALVPIIRTLANGRDGEKTQNGIETASERVIRPKRREVATERKPRTGLKLVCVGLSIGQLGSRRRENPERD